MTCHITVGLRCWCLCLGTLPILDSGRLRGSALESEIPILCQHESAADAVALVHLLQDFGIEACISDGECEWNPLHPDIRKLYKARRNKRAQQPA